MHWKTLNRSQLPRFLLLAVGFVALGGALAAAAGGPGATAEPAAAPPTAGVVAAAPAPGPPDDPGYLWASADGGAGYVWSSSEGWSDEARLGEGPGWLPSNDHGAEWDDFD